MGKFLAVASLFVLHTFLRILVIKCDKLGSDPESIGAAYANRLHEAVVGIGTNESAIIEVLTSQSNKQRQDIIREYENLFHTNLIEDLNHDTWYQFRQVIEALLLEPNVLLAKEIKRSLSKFVPDYEAIAEILCTRSKDELTDLVDTYKKVYTKELLAELDENFDGDHGIFLETIVTPKFRKSGEVDVNLAMEQTTYFPNTTDSCSISQNPDLKDFLAKEPFDQIHYAVSLYETNGTKSVETQLSMNCKDVFLMEAYMTVVRYAKDPIKYYAQQLYSAMKGLGTDDDKLIRIVVGRSEIDLGRIQDKYEELYHRTLASSVHADTSGDYRTMLIKLIENHKLTGLSTNGTAGAIEY